MRRITRGCIDAVEWSDEENKRLLGLIGSTTYRNIKRQFPERSLDAIKRQALRLGHAIHQGTWTLQRIVRETGYNWKQVMRAKDALKQHWMRTTTKRSKYLIRGEQVIEIIDYLAREPHPFMSKDGHPRLTWSRYHKQCKSCGTSSKPHAGRGMCGACLKRESRVKKEAENLNREVTQ